MITRRNLVMLVYDVENYLPEFNHGGSDDPVSTFLRNHMCHVNFEQTAHEISEMMLPELNIRTLTRRVYDHLKLTKYTKPERMRNIVAVNHIQHKKLARHDFNITYSSTGRYNHDTNDYDEPPGVTRTAKLSHKHVKLSSRSIVLYFRGPWRDFENTAGMDVFHVVLLYHVLHHMIRNCNFKFFNHVKIVSSDPSYERMSVFDDLNCSNSVGNDFITDTCLYANTIHFNGGTLPDLSSHTIPILSRNFQHFNNSNVDISTIDRDLILDAYYPEVQYTNGDWSYCPDPELYMDGIPWSWRDIMDDKYNRDLIATGMQQNFMKLIPHVVDRVYNLERVLGYTIK